MVQLLAGIGRDTGSRNVVGHVHANVGHHVYWSASGYSAGGIRKGIAYRSSTIITYKCKSKWLVFSFILGSRPVDGWMHALRVRCARRICGRQSAGRTISAAGQVCSQRASNGEC